MIFHTLLFDDVCLGSSRMKKLCARMIMMDLRIVEMFEDV